MFCLQRKSLINNDLTNYIKDTTNKSLEKYKKFNYLNFFHVQENNKPSDNNLFIIPFVSFFSFLAGYHFSSFFKNLKLT